MIETNEMLGLFPLLDHDSLLRSLLFGGNMFSPCSFPRAHSDLRNLLTYI